MAAAAAEAVALVVDVDEVVPLPEMLVPWAAAVEAVVALAEAMAEATVVATVHQATLATQHHSLPTEVHLATAVAMATQGPVLDQAPGGSRQTPNDSSLSRPISTPLTTSTDGWRLSSDSPLIRLSSSTHFSFIDSIATEVLSHKPRHGTRHTSSMRVRRIVACT